MKANLTMASLLDFADDVRRARELHERWPKTRRTVSTLMNELAREFNLAGGTAAVGELYGFDKKDGPVAVYINFTHLPGGSELFDDAYLNIAADYSNGLVHVQRSTNARRFLSLDELLAEGVEQLVLAELHWAIMKHFKLRDRVKARKTNKKFPKAAA